MLGYPSRIEGTSRVSTNMGGMQYDHLIDALKFMLKEGANPNFMVFDTNTNIRNDMLQILSARPELRFQNHFAEQMFLQWYFYSYLNWLPTMYTVTSDEENIDQAFTIHHSKKPFFRFAKKHLNLLTPEVRKCINLTRVPFILVDDGSDGLPSDHLPNIKDQQDAINVNDYGNT